MRGMFARRRHLQATSETERCATKPWSRAAVSALSRCVAREVLGWRCVVRRTGLVALGVAWSRMALADVDGCVEAHSRGQVLRDESKLVESQAMLLSCASDESCPAPVKAECEQYLEAVQRLTPTLVFAGRDHLGRDIGGVRTYMDGTLVEWVAGQAPLAVDPGPHVVRFLHPGGQIVEQRVDAVQGEKARLVVAEFSKTETVTATLPPATAPTASADRSARQIMTYAFGGLAVVGLASFVILGRSGKSEEADLRASCAPNCTTSQKQSVAAKYLWADVSLAVAGLSLAGGAVLYFAPLGSDDTAATLSFAGEF